MDRRESRVVMMRTFGKTVFWLLGSLSIAMAGESAGAATTTVYKCFDKNLAILYTDQPCKGEQMDIRAGDPDPVAVAELQREREALLRSAAQRIADNRRAAPERDYAVQRPYALVEAPASNGDGYYYGGYGVNPYPAAHRGRPPMRDARPVDRERFVPNPPRGLPRK